MNYQELVQKINDREMFSWSRWGDGEWNCLSQDTNRKVNCDRHTYFPELGQRLMGVLQSQPDYYIGLQSMAYKQRTEQIDAITEKYNLTWTNSNLLHHAAIKGNLALFIDALKHRDIILVGPNHIRKMREHFDCYVIHIPNLNCWTEYEDIKADIDAFIHSDAVVCYCASMMANVLIDDFNHRATQIDCGSVFDPFCGVYSRKYMRK